MKISRTSNIGNNFEKQENNFEKQKNWGSYSPLSQALILDYTNLDDVVLCNNRHTDEQKRIAYIQYIQNIIYIEHIFPTSF
jgi:hypothetical protein